MSDTQTPPPKPLLIELDDEAEADPARAAPVPDFGPDGLPEGRAMRAAGRMTGGRASGLVRAALWVFSVLFTFVLSVAAWDFIASLMARSPLLGGIALVLTGLAVTLALALALREWAAYMRLARLDRLRHQAMQAEAAGDLPGARAVVAALERVYAGRADLAEGLLRLHDRRKDVFDADAMLLLAETELLVPLDQRARREIEAAARQVATITALVPVALADVAAALFANLRMVRRIAEIYGGRSGGFASWGLMRRVFTYLLATGALALTDDLIGSVAGGGVLSKLSRRFGEGVVNGALTARIGVAAMELCRPLPFTAAPRPRVTNLISRALAGLFGIKAEKTDVKS